MGGDAVLCKEEEGLDGERYERRRATHYREVTKPSSSQNVFRATIAEGSAEDDRATIAQVAAP